MGLGVVGFRTERKKRGKEIKREKKMGEEGDGGAAKMGFGWDK